MKFRSLALVTNIPRKGEGGQMQGYRVCVAMQDSSHVRLFSLIMTPWFHFQMCAIFHKRLKFIQQY